jgi:hypothetical protein
MIPYNFTSAQTSDANIYVIGGSFAMSIEKTGLRQCLSIDANMTVYERENMSLGRLNTPLAPVRDRFIIACGG